MGKGTKIEHSSIGEESRLLIESFAADAHIEIFWDDATSRKIPYRSQRVLCLLPCGAIDRELDRIRYSLERDKQLSSGVLWKYNLCHSIAFT